MNSGSKAISAFRLAKAQLLSRYRLTVEEQYVGIKDSKSSARALVSGEGPPLLYVHGGGAFGGYLGAPCCPAAWSAPHHA